MERKLCCMTYALISCTLSVCLRFLRSSPPPFIWAFFRFPTRPFQLHQLSHWLKPSLLFHNFSSFSDSYRSGSIPLNSSAMSVGRPIHCLALFCRLSLSHTREESVSYWTYAAFIFQAVQTDIIVAKMTISRQRWHLHSANTWTIIHKPLSANKSQFIANKTELLKQNDRFQNTAQTTSSI